MQEFLIENRKIKIINEASQGPVVLLAEEIDGAKEVFKLTKQLGFSDYVLVSIEVLDWNNELSPYAAPSIIKKQEGFKGEAFNFLNLIENNIIPNIQNIIQRKADKKVIAGYSLAGLFAIYAALNSKLFTTAISVSGSLWYQDFVKDIIDNKKKFNVNNLYFSLGDKEALSCNQYLRMVEENTIRLFEYCQSLNLKCDFELNPGNHFQDENLRIAKAIVKALA